MGWRRERGSLGARDAEDDSLGTHAGWPACAWRQAVRSDNDSEQDSQEMRARCAPRRNGGTGMAVLRTRTGRAIRFGMGDACKVRLQVSPLVSLHVCPTSCERE